MQLALQVSRLAEHPEDHPGQETGRDEHRHAFEELLGGALELRVQDVEDAEEGDAHRGRRADPEPDPAVRASSADLGEVGEDDPGNKGHLDAFAKRDDQGAQVA